MAEGTAYTGSDRFIELQQINQMPIESFEEQPIVPLEKAVEGLIPLIGDILKYVDDAKNKCNKTSRYLTLDESAAIYLYTMPIGFSRLLNATFRAEDQSALEPWFPFLNLFISALKKLPSSKLTVWRAIDRNIDHFSFDNDMIIWWNIISTSTNLNAIQILLTDTSILLTIDALNGKNISEYSCFPDEQEVILMPGTRLRMITDETNLNNYSSNVHLKEYIIEQNTTSSQSPLDTSPSSDIIDNSRSILFSFDRVFATLYRSKWFKITMINTMILMISIFIIIFSMTLLFYSRRKTFSNPPMIIEHTISKTSPRKTTFLFRAY